MPQVEEYVIVPNADILVGVPCYKDGPMVARCLDSLVVPGVQLLIVDNGSAVDVKQAIAGKGLVIRNAVNRYVNPAWNQMMEWFLARSSQYDLLVLANSDLVLDPGWADKLRRHRAAHKEDQIIFGKVDPTHSSMGAFFAMTRGAVEATYPIPDDILIYGGDDYIFAMCGGVGFPMHVVDDLRMFHEVSGTIKKSPELWAIGGQDNQNLHHKVFSFIVPQRIKAYLDRKKDRSR